MKKLSKVFKKPLVISKLFKKQFLKLGLFKFCKKADIQDNEQIEKEPHLVVESVGFENINEKYCLHIRSNGLAIKILWTTSMEFAVFLTEVLMKEPINFFKKMNEFLQQNPVQYAFY